MSVNPKFTQRMHNLKEQLQRVAELELSAAKQALMEAEDGAAALSHGWQAALGGPVGESVVDLQYRTTYSTLMLRRLERQRQVVATAAQRVQAGREALRRANVATEQWAYLSEQERSRFLQAAEHRQQVEADDLASGRHLIGKGEDASGTGTGG